MSWWHPLAAQIKYNPKYTDIGRLNVIFPEKVRIIMTFYKRNIFIAHVICICTHFVFVFCKNPEIDIKQPMTRYQGWMAGQL